jgi:hypothetical protein
MMIHRPSKENDLRVGSTNVSANNKTHSLSII